MLFLDTGYLIALADASDQHHPAARAHWRALRPRPHLLTSSYVLDEAATFFGSRGFHGKAVDVVERLRSSSRVTVVHPDEALFDQAWAFFRARPDKRYSLTDCLSFVLMEREGADGSPRFRRALRAGRLRVRSAVAQTRDPGRGRQRYACWPSVTPAACWNASTRSRRSHGNSSRPKWP